MVGKRRRRKRNRNRSGNGKEGRKEAMHQFWKIRRLFLHVIMPLLLAQSGRQVRRRRLRERSCRTKATMRNWPGPNLGSVFPPSLPPSLSLKPHLPSSNATDEPTNQPTFRSCLPFFPRSPAHSMPPLSPNCLIIIKRQKTFLDNGLR